MSADSAGEKPVALVWLAAVPSFVTLCGTLSLQPPGQWMEGS
jgi:hypothetical protein